MDQTQIAYELMKAATSGVSKTQTIHHIKKSYNQTDEQVEQIIKLCAFKSKPEYIDYHEFANKIFPDGTKKFLFPKTQLYTFDNFLTPDECNILIQETDENLRPSTIADPTDSGVTSSYRTSKTADLTVFNSDYIRNLNDKICRFLKLSCTLGETLQVQKYAPGEYYKEHCDYFFPLTKEYKVYTEWLGQRTWTFMLYLNDVEKGGETYFKRLKVKIKPQAGKAVFWNNLYKNGIPNNKTLHEALPPISGEKYVITKWFRSWSLI